MIGRRARVTPISPTPATAVPRTVRPGEIDDYTRSKRNQRRSQEILDAIAQIDVTNDPTARQQTHDWIREVYDNRQGGELLGLFSRCYLGAPFVDHRLSITGGIMEHYKADDPVPPGFGPARPLARSSAYLFIEIYTDGQVVPIRNDGSSAL